MLNAISHTAEAQPLLEKGGVELNECVIHPGATFINVAAIRLRARTMRSHTGAGIDRTRRSSACFTVVPHEGEHHEH